MWKSRLRGRGIMIKYKIYIAITIVVIGICLSILGDGISVQASEQNPVVGELIEINSKIYYLYSDETFAMGWVSIGNDWFFFSPLDGSMAIDTTINGFVFGKDGKFIGMESEGEINNQQLKDFIDYILSVIIKPEMSEEEKINICYMHIINNAVYKRTYDTPTGDWTGAYAMQLLTTGEGNCYRYASAFAYLMTGLRYEAKVITGEIGARRGGTAPHGWTEVKIHDEWYIFDTEMQDANGKDYFKKTYQSYPSKPLIKMIEWEVKF